MCTKSIAIQCPKVEVRGRTSEIGCSKQAMFVGVGYSAQVDFLTRLVVIEHRVVTSDRTAPALSGLVPTPQPERTRAPLIKRKLQMMPLTALHGKQRQRQK